MFMVVAKKEAFKHCFLVLLVQELKLNDLIQISCNYKLKIKYNFLLKRVALIQVLQSNFINELQTILN